MSTNRLPPKRRLLLVDDETDFVSSLADILREFGYEVDSATTPSEAMRLIDQHHYDAAVLDFRMPEVNGIELHQKLRNVQGDLATIMLTAYADRSTHDAARDAGFWYVLEKPLDIPQIAEMIDGLTQRPLLLVVDDEPDQCESLYQVLHQHQIRATWCSRLEDALQQVQKRAFDIILLDVKFPDGSPLELIRFIHQQDLPTTIMIMTGHARESDAELRSIERLGIERVHHKPLDIHQLIREVQSLNARLRTQTGGSNDLN